MKLYATAVNEKGKQVRIGSDEYIIITLHHKNTVVRRLKLQLEHGTGGHNWEIVEEIPLTGGYCLHDYDNYGKCCNCGKWKHEEALKGNKQKGEAYEICTRCKQKKTIGQFCQNCD